MISLPEFFEINHEIILFAYGLVFFVLGFAIIIQTRRSSRLELARSLRWLAAFGITHGFNEWGDLFIPIQAAYLDPNALRVLYILQLILLTISFACLFEFGSSLLRALGRAVWLQGLSVGLVAGWFVSTFFVLLPLIQNEQEWRHLAIAFSRYFIGFPGGLLAAFGLRAYALERIVPLHVPNIVRTFKAVGHALATYAVLSGLIPPPINFFPGNSFNSDTFTQVVGAPPWVFRTLVAGVITVTVIRALEIFELETDRRIEELEQQQIIATERERYARELHDGTIQKVYTAGLLVESASRLADTDSKIGQRLARAVGVLNDTIADLRQNLAELHSYAHVQSEPLPVLLDGLANNPHYKSMVEISLKVDLPDSKSLSPRRSNHVMAIVNEALANAVRHAQAQKVSIVATDLGENVTIEIRDNGIGISSGLKIGYGLRNMRDRARLLNGSINFANDKGTTISLEIPWADVKL